MSRTQLCQPHMNENNSTKVNTIHMKAKLFHYEFHLDTETSRLLSVDSQLVLSKYSYYYKAHKNKPFANRLVTTD